MKIIEELPKDDIHRMMEISAVSVNRCALSVRGDLGMARLTFGEENTPGAQVHPRVAVSMPLSVLQSMHSLIGDVVQQMEAAHAARMSGTLSMAKN